MEFHDIWNGDSIELVKKFKPGRIDCIVTDPPFGVDNKSNMATTQAGKKYARKIANDESPEKAIEVFTSVFTNLEPALKPTADVYIFTSYQVLSDWLVFTDDLLSKFGYKRKAVITWEKDGPGMGDLESPWGMGIEFILFFQRGRSERNSKRRNSVLHIPQLRPDKLIHPHEKPLPLLETLIKASTREGDFIVDPFAGSGSTVRAARNVNRNAIGIEYDEMNASIAKKALDQTSEGLF